jgi:hypothetical protein
MSWEQEIVAAQDALAGYEPGEAVRPADAARVAGLVRRSKLKKGVTAGALHRLLDALAEAGQEFES